MHHQKFSFQGDYETSQLLSNGISPRIPQHLEFLRGKTHAEISPAHLLYKCEHQHFKETKCGKRDGVMTPKEACTLYNMKIETPTNVAQSLPLLNPLLNIQIVR